MEQLKSTDKMISSNEDTCVCCGAVIPEGRMVCADCLNENNVVVQWDKLAERKGWFRKEKKNEATEKTTKKME